MLMLCCSMRSCGSFLVLLLCQALFAQVAYSDTPPLRIGALMALTGQYSMQVGAFREGLELAADQLNSEGGINGARVELLVAPHSLYKP